MLSWPLLLTASMSLGLASSPSAPGARAPYALQPAGTFHGSEPIARDGEVWMALREHEGRAELVRTTLQVRPVRDELLDESDAATGLEVLSPSVPDAEFFLRGHRIVEGAVTSVDFHPRERVAGPLRIEFTFDQVPYRIDTRCQEVPFHSGQRSYDCEIVLHGRGRSQRLFKVQGYSEPGTGTLLTSDDGMAQLRFVGDLDGDGAFDLIFDASDHYNVSRPTLFLSSQAGVGELVGQVAQYESVGC